MLLARRSSALSLEAIAISDIRKNRRRKEEECVVISVEALKAAAEADALK